MAEPNKVQQQCADCICWTQHDVLHEQIQTIADEYRCQWNFRIVQCRGCSAISFQEEVVDFESRSEDDEPEITVRRFPQVLAGHRDLPNLYQAPKIVRNIYKEAITAYREGAHTLAGLGMRATLEAVCNDKGIKGRDLMARISGLTRAGWVARQDADRLHAIRFLGTDAAHDLKPPNLQQLEIATRIVEHLLDSVYLLDRAASRHLEPALSSLEDCRWILKKAIKEVPVGEERTLSGLLGRQHRRLIDNFDTIEAELIAAISAGDFPDLVLGATHPDPDPKKKPYQFFKRPGGE